MLEPLKPQKFKSQTLTDFINHNNLIVINMSSKNSSAPYTFLPTKTTLDYIMVDSQNFDLVLDYETLQISFGPFSFALYHLSAWRFPFSGSG